VFYVFFSICVLSCALVSLSTRNSSVHMLPYGCCTLNYSNEGDSNASGGVWPSSEGDDNSQTKDLQDHDATQTNTRT